MALSDPTQIITTELNDISYTAGQEPWNKNLDQFSFDSKETDINVYVCEWTKWHGIYRSIPEARSTIDVWSAWVVGKKIEMDDKTQKIIDRIEGNSKDTFRIILKNMKRTSKICGDAFADIVRDKAGRVINIKMLNPGTIKIESNNLGIIQRYVQTSIRGVGTSKSNNDNKKLITWEPEEMFHISNDRIADEIHGIPELEKTFNIMKWKHQSMGDLATVFHRYVYPILEIYAKTDDATELTAIEKQYNKSVKNMESRIIPAGAIEKVDRVSIPQFSTLDPLPWQKFLRSYYTETSNVPDIIRGKSDEVSLAAGKLNVFAYREKIMFEQVEYEEQIKQQLGITLKFEEPPEPEPEQQPFGNNNEKENKSTSKQADN